MIETQVFEKMSKKTARVKTTTGRFPVTKYFPVDEDEYAILLEKALKNKDLNLRVSRIVGPTIGKDVGYVDYTNESGDNIKISIKVPLSDPIFAEDSSSYTTVICIKKRFIPLVQISKGRLVY